MSRGLHRPEAAVYAPERRWSRDLPEKHRTDLTRRQVTNLVAKVWAAEKPGQRPPTIRWTGRYGGASANRYTRELMFTHNSIRQATPRWLVLHELAHLLDGHQHDEWWLRAYERLVNEHIGTKAAKQLWLLLKDGCQVREHYTR